MGTEPGFKDKLVWLQTVRGFILSPIFNHQTWQCFEISVDVSVSPHSSTGTPKRRLFSPPWKILFFFHIHGRHSEGKGGSGQSFSGKAGRSVDKDLSTMQLPILEQSPARNSPPCCLQLSLPPHPASLSLWSFFSASSFLSPRVYDK